MAANILRSKRTREMSVFIIRAFAKLREETAGNAVILKRFAEIDRTLLVHEKELRKLYQQLRPLLAPGEVSSKRRIGFRTPGEEGSLTSSRDGRK